MSFKIINHVLAANLASAGTVALAYPTGTSKGAFQGGQGHVLIAMQSVFNAPTDFTLTFNAADITLTYLGSTTIPASSALSVQVEQPGENDGEPDDLSGVNRVALAPTVLVDLGSPDTADDNGYIVSQDLTALGVFSVSVTAAAALLAAALDGVADVPRNVVAAWTTTAVLTITGTDEYGNVIVENSASGTAHTGKKAFKTITDITTSVDITSLTVGTGVVLGLPVFLTDKAHVLSELQDGAALGRISEQVVRIPFQIDEVELLAATPLSFISPVAGVISEVVTMVSDAVTTGGTITGKINNVAIDGLSVVVADAAPAGAVDRDSPTAAHASTVVAVDDEIELIVEAAFATAGAVTGYIVIVPDAQDNGTVVAGDTAAATALTGDVRGTYSPAATPDGALGFQILAFMPDPTYKGLAQFAG